MTLNLFHIDRVLVDLHEVKHRHWVIVEVWIDIIVVVSSRERRMYSVYCHGRMVV